MQKKAKKKKLHTKERDTRSCVVPGTVQIKGITYAVLPS